MKITTTLMDEKEPTDLNSSLKLGKSRNPPDTFKRRLRKSWEPIAPGAPETESKVTERERLMD